MPRAQIIVHLPSHRRTALKIEGDTREAEETYDGQIGAYLEFLKREALAAGFQIETDERDWGPIFTIDELDHDAKKAAHDWLNTQPDFWNWLPSA
ncbi:hypothetical protein [Solimonas flava]|uniref:hypothetical protein n=1 Tax=Solimonas flava TaxID=415849 RepID=UPI000417EB16|nr:hypothetical protein [Solimonas flava]